MSKTAVLLMAYGGPDSLDDIEAYLLHVRGGRPTSPELIAEIKERYALIGGKSPLLEITRQVAVALEERLNKEGDGKYQVFIGMRHWFPYIRETVQQIAAQGYTRIISICMTPFASRMTTAVYFQHLNDAIQQAKEQYPNWAPQEVRVASWHLHPRFVKALATNVQQGLLQFKNTAPITTIFSAHSLPAVVGEEGDPYPQQFYALAAAVANHADLESRQWTIAYQSAGAGKIPWLQPSVDNKLEELAKKNHKNVLVAPIGFLSDHVEVLFDLDIEAKQEAEKLGISLERICSLNDDSEFIEVLFEIISEEMKQNGWS